MLDLYLNTLWMCLAIAVCWQYASGFAREPRGTRPRMLMLGITIMAGAVALGRLYWMPWYWLHAVSNDEAVGSPSAHFYSFWNSVTTAHDKIMTVALVASIFGLYLHRYLVSTPLGLFATVRRSWRIFALAAVPTAAAWISWYV